MLAIQKQILEYENSLGPDPAGVSSQSLTFNSSVSSSAAFESLLPPYSADCKDILPLSSYMQCEEGDVNIIFSIWVFLTRFSTILSMNSLDLEEFSIGLQLYSGNSSVKLKKPSYYYLHLIDLTGICLVTYLLNNESELPVLVDESPGVSHVISSHEALLKFISEFECVRSGVTTRNWMFILLAVLLLHSPSQTSLFDHIIVDICDTILSSDYSLLPFNTLMQLFAETVNLISLTNPIRDSLLKTINPATGELTSRGRPRLST